MSLLIGLIVRVFGAREGIFPQHLILKKIRSSPILEFCGALSLCVIFFGFYLAINLVQKWADLSFGPLDKENYLRTVSFSTFLIATGGVGFLGSLVIGFLSLPIRR
jgi:hypothetical protein